MTVIEVWPRSVILQIQEEFLFETNQRLGQSYDVVGEALLQIGETHALYTFSHACVSWKPIM